MKLRLNYVNLAYFQSRSSSKDLQLKYYKFTNNKTLVDIIRTVSKGELAAFQINNSTAGSSEITKKFIGIPSLSILTGHVEGLESYPLNLLSDMYVINMSAITFLFLMLNVFIATYLHNKSDLWSYFPQWVNSDTNKLGKLIKYLINRNIKIWYGSRIFILIFSWCMLFIALMINQTGFLIILNST